jgi:phosphate transport system substrate-binding protein
MKRRTLEKLVWVLAVLSLGAVSAVMAQSAAKSLMVNGSTTVGPIADAFAEALMKKDPALSITVKKTGSGDGAKALVDGLCDIATMSRFMKDKEYKAVVEKGALPVAHAIAMDGVCVIVHPTNPVSGLTGDQIRGIYAGRITNWKEVGGVDAPIVGFSRDTSSGTYETFEGLIMKGEKMAAGVGTVGSNPEMHDSVATTPGAIGYVGLGFLGEKVKALPVNGIMPNKGTIASGVYPIARPLFLFTRGYPELGSAIHTFSTFYLTEEGQEIIEAKGFVPLTNY